MMRDYLLLAITQAMSKVCDIPPTRVPGGGSSLVLYGTTGQHKSRILLTGVYKFG